MASSVDKMSMGGGSSGGMSGQGNSSMAKTHACKISMLWNWNTLDTCFIAKSWHNDTRGKFAGSCIGCFALVLVAQWLNRISRQFDLEVIEREKFKIYAQRSNSGYFVGEEPTEEELSSSSANELSQIGRESSWQTTLIAFGKTLSHTWYIHVLKSKLLHKDRQVASLGKTVSWNAGGSYAIYPSFPVHITRVIIFVLQWGLSYFIMLLFMYYNGYIIISCIIGALVGRFLFNYEPLAVINHSFDSDTEIAHDKEVDDRKCCM